MTETIVYNLNTIKTEFTANGYTPLDQYGSEIIGLSNGGFAVVYGTLYTGNNYPLVTFYKADFTPVHDYIGPYSDLAVDMRGSPDIVQLADGNVAVTWHEGSNGDNKVLGAIFDPVTGGTVHSAFVVTSFMGYGDPEATALSGASGNWVVAMSNGTDTIFQIMSATGAQLGSLLPVGGAGHEIDPVITALDDDGFVITYTNDTSGDDLIYAEIYNSNGNIRTPAFLVGQSGDNNQSAVAALPLNKWAVVYSDTGWVDGDGLTLQIFNGNGAEESPLIRVDTSLNAIEQDPDITVLENGFFVVSWTHPFSPGDNDIYARVYSSDGTPIVINGSSDPFTITSSGTDDRDASISSFFSGVFGAVWTDSEDTPTDESGGQITGEINELVRTSTGDDAVNNFAGDALRDIMYGAGGADVLSGYGGNDTLNGGAGADVLDGGAGTDTASYAGASGGVVASLANAAINTEDAAGDTYNSIENLIGSDKVDFLNGSNGVNEIRGNNGSDTIKGYAGADQLYGDIGDDTLIGGVGADALDGGDGKDTASYFGATAGVIASLANPAINSGDAAGDTYISIENLIGSGFDDALNGDNFVNDIRGDLGQDILKGYGDDDKLYGQDGNDTLIGGVGADLLNGAAGSDTASYLGATAGVTASLADPAANTGDAAGDSYVSIEHLTGSGFADKLSGNAGANRLDGGAGNDTLIGGDGADELIGGADIDTASYSGATAGVVASLANAAINTGFAAGDTYNSIENLAGSKFDDSLFGNNSANVINGGAGNDTIKGYGGNDTLTGGAGEDTFNFNTALDAATNVDTISDFNDADDTVQLDNVVFTALAATGALASGFFRANATGTAQDSNDYIVYETDTGKLFYDADGNGAGAAIQFATLAGNPVITAADFAVI
jgi:Ca2+-binding RTX toxin-like protein